jgi:hypothetical protein
LEDIGVYGKIILKRILRELFGREWAGFFWLRMGTGGGLF